MSNYLVTGTSPDDPPESDEESDAPNLALEEEDLEGNWEDDVWEEDFPTGKTEQIDNGGGW